MADTQWQTREDAKEKDRTERRNCGRLSEFETFDSLQPCEVFEGHRYWFSGLQRNCSKCKPQPLDCIITFEVAKLAWCTPSPQRLRKMDEDELKRHGKGCAWLCQPEQNHGRAPRETFVLQLAEARAEWRRRRARERGVLRRRLFPMTSRLKVQ